MPQDSKVKICGLREAAHVELAGRLGAAYVGFVFFPKSPRHLTVTVAAELAAAEAKILEEGGRNGAD